MRHDPWAVVLAAGAGRRLAPLTRGVPKQFWSADGRRTLLGDTLRRTALVAPPGRTVVVIDRTHAPFAGAVPELRDVAHVVVQPGDRGTAAGVLLGLETVLASGGLDAHLVLTPSDHGVSRPALFARGLRHGFGHVDRGASDIVLFGVEPDSPEGDYGWIERADRREQDPRVRSVLSFVEKPPVAEARSLYDAGAVWNTMVLVARARRLRELIVKQVPEVAVPVLEAMAVAGDRARALALAATYDRLTPADFSRDVLAVAGDLGVYTWPAAMGWADLGTPERLAAWLCANGGVRPARDEGRPARALQPLAS